jgi:hypothetical protein
LGHDIELDTVPITNGTAAAPRTQQHPVDANEQTSSEATALDTQGASAEAIQVPPAAMESRSTRMIAIAKTVLFYSWINVLLIMVPVAIGVHFANGPPVAQFVCACLAIIPLAALLGFATEELAKRFGNALSALLNIR